MKWIESTIGDVCDAGGGEVKTGPFGSQLHQSDYSTVGTPVVMPKDIIEGDVSDLSIARVGPDHVDRLSKHKLNEGDIVYGRRGDIGRQALITKKTEGWLCGTGCLRVTIGKPAPVIPSFLHLYLRQNDVISWIANQAVGATMPNLNTSILRSVPVRFPESKAHQEKLADIVCSYDALIENNNRRIAILEEMAQSLYREWFVKFRFPGHEQSQMVESPLGLIPEGWDIKAFTDLASFMNGFAFKASHFSDDGLAVVKIPELRNGPTTKTPYCLKNTVPEKYLIQNGDLIFSWSGSFVIKEWTFGDALLNQHLFKVTPIEQDNKRFIEISLQAALPRMLNQSVGATMKHIRRSTLTETKTIVPPIDLLSIFNEQVNSLINLAVNLEKKNQNLKKQRDLLLPKLISGQINLSQAEQAKA
ncbi:MAG: restriction endonuclease subunit S [Neptuniibacter sp.]